jgi:signal transduction histidine kinase
MIRTSSRILTLVQWLLIGATVAGLHSVATASAPDGQKRVLVLYAARGDAQIAVIGDRELPRVLEQGLPEGLDYYSEFMDTGRMSQLQHQVAFRDFLRLKYQGQSLDLVIAMGDAPFDFLSENRDVFAATPVVFFSDGPSPRPLANSTGVLSRLDLHSTVAFAAELQPDIRHVFVVSGAGPSGESYESVARTQLRPFESRLAINYLSGLPTKELEARLKSLPEHSVVFYLVVDRDGANENFHPLEYLDRLSAVANAPIYCWVDSAMDHGIVGGSLKDQVAQTHAIAQLALRVLRGERAESIPVSSPDLTVRQVDWRELRRWGISESRVPAGTVIRFRELSAWDRYKVYILSGAALLLAQTVLIAGLLVHRARRRQAEDQVRGSRAELRISYERIRDLGARLLNAQEAERSRIARDLHDDISQQLALLAIDLELLGNAARDQHEDLAAEALTRVHGIARSVHDLSHRLHPAKLRLLGLVSALRALRRELSKSDISITITHDNVPAALPPDLTLCLFRVVQEALQNAVKYSGAREVSVDIHGGPDGLELIIADDGVGFDVDAAWGRGLGLISMRERLEAIGASLEIRSKSGAGTRLEVRVPVPVVHGPETAAV